MSSDVTAELVALSDLSTPLATLLGTHDRQFQEILCDTGSGQIVFQNDDTDLALVTKPNSLVNFYLEGWTPLLLPNLAAWYDASVASSIASSGGLVSQWNDLSGNGNHLTAAGTRRPTTGSHTLNGLNVLAFDGVANLMAKTGVSVAAGDTMTVFVVVKPSATTSFERVFSLDTGGNDYDGANRIAAILRDNTNLGMAAYYNNVERGTKAMTNAAHVVTSQRNGDSHVIRVDGSPGTTVTGLGTANFAITQIEVGGYNLAGGGASFFTGDYAAAIWVNGIPSAADSLLTEAYLLAEWGMSGGTAGRVLAFTMLCEHFEATLVDQNEESAEVTIWTGRGHSALLDRALTYPSNGVDSWPIQDDRIMNYTDPFCFDDSLWVPAHVVCSMATAQASWPGRLWDATFPPCDILAAPGDTLTTAVLGTRYIRQDITVPSSGHYVIYYGADDTIEIYIDGSIIASTNQNGNFDHRSDATIDLTAGTHVVALAVTNMAWAGPAANPCGAGWSIYTPGFPATLIAKSDSSAVVTFPAAVPGMTPGAAILCLLGEAQARGTIPYITTSFTTTHDTAGNAWPVVPDISTKVGTSLLTFLKELSATYIDWYMAPGTYVLDAWAIGGRTTTPGVDFHSPTDNTHPTTGNLTSHKETGEA